MVLQKMRAGAQGLAAKILVGLIVFVLAVFGFGAFNLFSVSEPLAASVNGEDITERDLELETIRQRNIQRARFGEEISDELLESLISRQRVLAGMIEQALLRQAAEEMDLSVGDAAVQTQIRELFAGEDGFDETIYRNWLANAGYTPTTFRDEMARDAVRNQLSEAIRDSAFVTNRELQWNAQVTYQGRDIAWMAFDVQTLAEGVEIEDDTVETYYGNHIDDYMTEEQFDFDYVLLGRDSLEEDVEVDEEAVALAYEDEVAAASQPRRRAAHILLETGEQRSVEEATQMLAEVRGEIEAGSNFEDRARELSEDPGSKEDGGDLGASAKGVFPPAFEEALWALEPGEISDPVATEFGVHLVKLIEIEAVEVPTLAERREEIVQNLRREEAQRRFEQVVRDMDTIAFEQGASLDGLTAEYGLTVESLDSVTRSSGDGLLADQEVREALFDDEVLLEGFNSRAVAAPTGALVARLRTRHPATERPLAEVGEEIRTLLAHQRARELAEEAAFDALTDMTSGATPAELQERSGIPWQRADAARRDSDQAPNAVLRTAFEMQAPAPGERQTEIATLADGSRAVVVLSNVTLGDYGVLGETDRTALADSLAQRNAARDYASLLAALRADASIDALAFEPEGP